MVPDYFSRFQGSIGEDSDAGSKLSLTDSHLLAVCEVPRLRYISCVDVVSDDDI